MRSQKPARVAGDWPRKFPLNSRLLDKFRDKGDDGDGSLLLNEESTGASLIRVDRVKIETMKQGRRMLADRSGLLHTVTGLR